MTGHRCVENCNGASLKKEIETTVRYWSDVDNWPDKVLPKAGDLVEISPGWNMVYDLNHTDAASSPIYKMITIIGRLTI